MAQDGQGSSEHILAVLAESAEDIRSDRVYDAAEVGLELKAMIREARERLAANPGLRM